jgi:hypothetical protein
MVSLHPARTFTLFTYFARNKLTIVDLTRLKFIHFKRSRFTLFTQFTQFTYSCWGLQWACLSGVGELNV